MTTSMSRVTAWQYLEYLVAVSFAAVDVHYQPTDRPLTLDRRAEGPS